MSAFARPSRACCAALALALAFGWSASARADESPTTLVERGIDLRMARRDEEALALFRRAYEMSPEPRTRAQIGLAEQALGMWAAAEADLEAALASRNDPWIAKNAQALEGALATVRSRLGSLEVRVNAAGAELIVDGRSVGRLPLERPVRLPVGTHRIEVRAEGFVPAARTIEIASGGMLRESFELAPELEARPPAPPGRPPAEPARATSPGATQRALGFSLFGVGLAAGAFAGVSFALRDGEVRSYNEDASCPGRASSVQPPACLDKMDAADRWLTIGIATAVGGGVFALGGLVIALTAPRDAPRSVACTLGGCGIRF